MNELERLTPECYVTVVVFVNVTVMTNLYSASTLENQDQAECFQNAYRIEA